MCSRSALQLVCHSTLVYHKMKLGVSQGNLNIIFYPYTLSYNFSSDVSLDCEKNISVSQLKEGCRALHLREVCTEMVLLCSDTITETIGCKANFLKHITIPTPICLDSRKRLMSFFYLCYVKHTCTYRISVWASATFCWLPIKVILSVIFTFRESILPERLLVSYTKTQIKCIKCMKIYHELKKVKYIWKSIKYFETILSII